VGGWEDQSLAEVCKIVSVLLARLGLATPKRRLDLEGGGCLSAQEGIMLPPAQLVVHLFLGWVVWGHPHSKKINCTGKFQLQMEEFQL
jgi:hypothetical protein